MNFISTAGMTHQTAPRGQVLIQYLNPFFGSLTVDYGIGFYDNPNDYEPAIGKGWCLWQGEKQVSVVAYAVLPPSFLIDKKLNKQDAFLGHYGSFHPHHGSVGELIISTHAQEAPATPDPA